VAIAEGVRNWIEASAILSWLAPHDRLDTREKRNPGGGNRAHSGDFRILKARKSSYFQCQTVESAIGFGRISTLIIPNRFCQDGRNRSKATFMSYSIQSIYNWYRNTLRNPKYRWWIILGTLAYVLSPFDISPDFLPIVGQIDDIAVISLLVAEVSQMTMDYFKSRQGDRDRQGSDFAVNSENATTTVDVEASGTPVSELD
jgi:uncharacterized membrane protein YkvA (DUF1232 family)